MFNSLAQDFHCALELLRIEHISYKDHAELRCAHVPASIVAILAQKVVIEETLAEWKFSHPEFADCDGNPDIKLSMRNERNSAMSKIRYLRKSLEKKNKNILSDNL